MHRNLLKSLEVETSGKEEVVQLLFAATFYLRLTLSAAPSPSPSALALVAGFGRS